MMRLLAPLFVLLLTLGTPLAVLAQDAPLTPPVLCGDLDEADCAILESSQQAMRDATSFAFDVVFSLNTGGFPDMPVDPVAFDVTTTGKFSLDPAAAVAARAMSDLSLQGAAVDAEMIENLPGMLLDLYSGLALDVSVNLQTSEEIAALLAAESDTPFPASLDIPLRMVDGTLYINIASLKELDPSMDEVSADWLGIDVVGALEQSLADAPVTDEGANEAAMASAVSGAVTMQVMKAIEPYVTVERMDNVDLGDQEGAVFCYLDRHGWLHRRCPVP
ncbi:MAG: hypothetical protein IPK16_07740 [Anaerolineales bacterium]|nr:hypothetical protein [Anaerolineales bacterium]